MLAALATWLLVAGVARVGLSVTALRVPLLLVMVALAVSVVRRLTNRERELVLRGLLLLGVLHACVVLGQALGRPDANAWQLRADSLVDHPNALGIFLVATGLIGCRELGRTRSPWVGAALAVQATALLLTGSRLALALAVLVVLWRWLRGQGRTWAPAALLFSSCAVLVMALRSAAPEPRPWLWLEATAQIAERPWLGWGPQPRLLTTDLPGARPTTHAHNELLQLALDYGLVWLALATLALAWWLSRQQVSDAWVVAAAVCVAMAGLGDISLRFPPVAITLGVLIGVGCGRRLARRPGPKVRRTRDAEEVVVTDRGTRGPRAE